MPRLCDREDALAAVGAAVIRALPLDRLRPLDVSAEGRRGTNAKMTAATTASAAPTQSRLLSTAKSRARTEKRDA